MCKKRAFTPHMRLALLVVADVASRPIAEDNDTRWPRTSMRKLGHTHTRRVGLFRLGSHAPASSARSVHLFTYFSWSSSSGGYLPLSSPRIRHPRVARHSLGFRCAFCPALSLSLPFSPFPRGLSWPDLSSRISNCTSVVGALCRRLAHGRRKLHCYLNDARSKIPRLPRVCSLSRRAEKWNTRIK